MRATQVEMRDGRASSAGQKTTRVREQRRGLRGSKGQRSLGIGSWKRMRG